MFSKDHTGVAHLKGGEAWKDNLLDLMQYGNNANLITRRIIMTKKQNEAKTVSPLSKVLNNDVDSTDNTNKEVNMTELEAANARIAELEAEVKKKNTPKAKVCTKKWSCVMSKKDIRTSEAPPQFQQIMQCVRQEAEENPDVEYHESDAILERLLDEDNDHAMTFSAKYRGSEPEVLRKRAIEVMVYYAHPDRHEEAELDRALFDVR
tara:strand:+ start:45 stop:665 length:621 start_codon:yes stop_codon:yes gene_type:complete